MKECIKWLPSPKPRWSYVRYFTRLHTRSLCTAATADWLPLTEQISISFPSQKELELGYKPFYYSHSKLVGFLTFAPVCS